MRRLTKTLTIATGGALAGGALAATPVLAAGGPPSTNPAGPPAQADAGPHAGMRGNGDCIRLDGSNLSIAPSGTLTEAQRAALAGNAANEKLAQDLYQAFADRYSAVVFDRIAAAEAQHLAVNRTLLERYGIADPTANTATGQFTDPAVQATYDRLLAQGSAGQQAALEAGRTAEADEIAYLRAALTNLTAPDVQRVYTNLLDASQRHLDAFTTWLAR